MREREVEFDLIEYLKDPIDRATFIQILRAIPNSPGELVRKDKRFKELGLDPDDYLTEDAVIALLIEHPALMERPVVLRGARGVIARPSENILTLLN